MLKPWTVLETGTVHQDKWLTIRRDCCRTERGEIVDPYYVIEYPDWVNVVALTRSCELILVRQYRHGAAVVLDELPGGSVDAGDASPQVAAGRELAEETGYAAKHMVPVGSCFANPANQSNRVHTFFAFDVGKQQGQRLDMAEAIEVVIVDFNTFLENVFRGEKMLQGLHVAAIQFAIQYIMKSGQPALTDLKNNLVKWFSIAEGESLLK